MGLGDLIDITDWDIQEELYLSLVLTFLLVVASYGMAVWWHRWRAGRKAKRS